MELHDFRYNEGLAKVEYNEQVGFIDSNKTIVIPLIYEDELGANTFVNSKAVVVKNQKWGVIDSTGATFIPFKYDRIRQRDGLFHVEVDYEWGYLDEKGQTILPIRDYGCSSIMSKEEIFALAGKHYTIDSLENAVPISKEKAISIAKRRGFYVDEGGVFSPTVTLDNVTNEWKIYCSERKGATYKGPCAHTNGCLVQKKYEIIIDAQKGKVKRKSKHKVVIPIYE